MQIGHTPPWPITQPPPKPQFLLGFCKGQIVNRFAFQTIGSLFVHTQFSRWNLKGTIDRMCEWIYVAWHGLEAIVLRSLLHQTWHIPAASWMEPQLSSYLSVSVPILSATRLRYALLVHLSVFDLLLSLPETLIFSLLPSWTWHACLASA